MSSTATPPNPLSDGLPSLVLSKKYLTRARPPLVYKVDRDNRVDENDHDDGLCGSAAVEWQPTTWIPSPTSAVQARYEPSDVFTPLVFEEIQTSSPPPPPPTQPPIQFPPSLSMWILPSSERVPTVQPQLPFLAPSAAIPTKPYQTTAANQRRPPLQHIPSQQLQQQQPPPSSGSTDCQNGNKPGDLSWLVNFQVASIFEPTVGGGGNIFGGEWQESEMLKQRKRTVKTESKPPNKINRKPYRLPPSRLDKANKPGYTYTEMIHQALMEKKELPVAEIYQWISSHFPYFREDDERWKNSVRHNLSINPNFRKGRKSQGAGHYWRLCNSEESLGQREFPASTEDDTSSPSELEQACKYLEGELQREDSLEDVKLHQSIESELENEIFTNSFLISSPSKYVNEQITLSNNNDFHSYGENLLEESIDFQYYNL